ncbi:MAG: transcription elongation factor subunit Spt4 [Candidatus Bilamarchaeaceae archaeon]
MKACKNCHMVIMGTEKNCPKCGGELSEQFAGMIIVLDPEHSEIAKIASINTIGAYAIRVK